MIQHSKNIFMFVAYFAKVCFVNDNCSSFFYGYTKADIYGYKRLSNPCGYYDFVVIVLWRVWEAIAFLISLISNFIHKMPKYNEICNAANNSTCTATSAHDTCILSPEVRILKDCSFSTFEKFLSCIKSDPKEDAHGVLKIVSGTDYREVSFISPDGTLTLQMKKGGLS